ncbi:MAG TPA: hypothetical protein VLE02_01620 [Nitrosarchaeum sp.]|nr:hypothetical protein [Nitrosarchaeum sp.]
MLDTEKYSVGGYRFMRFPLNEEIQHLNFLYPGRFMDPNYHYSGDNIPHDHHDKLMHMKFQIKSQFLKSKENELKMSQYLKGKHSIHRTPAVQPEEVIEDASLNGLRGDNRIQHGKENYSTDKSCFVHKPAEDVNDYVECKGTEQKKCSVRCDSAKECFSFSGNPVCCSPKYNKFYWICIVICVLILMFLILCTKK